jgi:hypothetical protein
LKERVAGLGADRRNQRATESARKALTTFMTDADGANRAALSTFTTSNSHD